MVFAVVVDSISLLLREGTVLTFLVARMLLSTHLSLVFDVSIERLVLTI